MKILLSVLFAVVLGLCAHAKINVVASTPDLGAIASEIGGDKVEVTTLAKPSEDPHFVDPKPSFKVKLNRADLLIEGGAELEMGWLPPLLEGARNNKLDIGTPGRIRASEVIAMLEVPTALDRSHGDIHATGNPHFMSDPENGRKVAEQICNGFSRIEAGSADVFRANLAAFNRKLDAGLARWHSQLVPVENKGVVSYHNSWPYFARRFGLKTGLFLEPKPGIPPTPAHLAKVITRMKQEHAAVIVVQPFQNRKTAETVARHAGATVVDFPLFPRHGQGYVEWIDTLIDSLVKAFKERQRRTESHE